MTGSTGAASAVSTEQVRVLAAAAGVDLDETRAAALVPQAEPHISLMHTVAAIDNRGAEPAGEFRLDSRQGTADV